MNAGGVPRERYGVQRWNKLPHYTSASVLLLVNFPIDGIVHRVKEMAGITDVPVTPHKFRHTFARTWLERGGELYSLSRLMGHSSVKVTEIYLEDFQSRQARLQHTRFSPVGRLTFQKTSKRKPKYRHYQQQADDDNE